MLKPLVMEKLFQYLRSVCGITSLKPDAVLIAEMVKEHWGVENGLHWRLDIVFGFKNGSASDAKKGAPPRDEVRRGNERTSSRWPQIAKQNRIRRRARTRSS